MELRSPKLLGTANIDPIQNEEIQCIPVKGSGQLELREGFQIVLLLLRLRTSPESFFFNDSSKVSNWLSVVAVGHSKSSLE